MKTFRITSTTTLADVVGFAQEDYKGQNFCSLIAVVKNEQLYFESCPYQGPLSENKIPLYVKALGGNEDFPCVFEHFLQSVRKNLPGMLFFCINFQKGNNCWRISPA